MNDLRQIISATCYKAITCGLNDREKVIDIVHHLVEQYDKEKSEMFINM